MCSPTRSNTQRGLYPTRLSITAPDCHLPKIVLEKQLNTGVMFRARFTGPEKNVVAGPQFNLEPFSQNRDWSGGIYGRDCGGWYYPLWLPRARDRPSGAARH